MRSFSFFFLLLAASVSLHSGRAVAEPVNTYEGVTTPLWAGTPPHAVGKTPKDIPELTLHLPDPQKKNRTAVIVCPGGGYGGTAISYEGHDVAKWFNNLGVTVYVLRYRHAPNYKHPVPLMDAQHALRIARSRANELGYDKDKIGILGFSAGGHLTSTTGTHYDSGNPQAADPIERESCKPNFMVLVYPVITMQDDFTHKGSRRNLLGNEPDPKLVELLSSERQVTPETPPAFIFHTTEDKAVPVENAVRFYLALRQNQVPVEMHIYEKGRHGLGLAQETQDTYTWPTLLKNWLTVHKLLEK